MSFMFHPDCYSDPRAVNTIDLGEKSLKDMDFGILPICKSLSSRLKDVKVLGIDGYASAPFEAFKAELQQYIKRNVRWIDATSVLLEPGKYEAVIAPCLPTDREIDPVLLYGVRYEGGYKCLTDPQRLQQARELASASKDELVVIIGQGALAESLDDLYDYRIWIDVTPRQAALNYKYNGAKNLQSPEAMPFGAMMRRNYYVDYELAVNLRWDLIRKGELDYYISADNIQSAVGLSYGVLKEIFDLIGRKPLRCRPVYLEGVWGGFFFKRLRKLPERMKNCAWVFDMIPMEVSLAARIGDKELEVPFFTYVQQQGRKLLGDKAFDMFNGYFPVRFNYDDTYHSSGNMSIQCHPGADYVVKNHNELGRQDESYYICQTGQGACTYLGFNDESSCKEFFKAAREAEKTHKLIDYKKYVNAVPSIPGTQVMIPAGTIHASGQNQVILEIGSLTIGSYTYKLYDYQRIDPQSGLPRPIHLNAGEKVIHPERTHQWVEDNLVNHGYVVRQGSDKLGEGGNYWIEKVVGEHDLLYFSLRNLVFEKSIDDDTDGDFHVLTLVDGESVRVQSKTDSSRYFDAQLMDIVVVPSDFGAYTIINKGVGYVTIHKTMLKRQ